MYALTAHILLDVYDPMMRNISIGEFGSYRARQQLEVSMTLIIITIAEIIMANSSVQGPHSCKADLRYHARESRQCAGNHYSLSLRLRL